MNKNKFFRLLMASVFALAFILTGCIGEDDKKDNNAIAVLDGIEIDAYAIYHPATSNAEEYTEVSVPVYNRDYTSPVINAVVKINGVIVNYNSTSESYTTIFSNILPGDDIEFSITINNETYIKTLAMPGQMKFNQPAYGYIFNGTINNTVTWSYENGNAPEKVILFVGYLPEKYSTELTGSSLSYEIPANTFDGTEAFVYVGARAMNFYNDPDGRKKFEVFTGDEYFAYFSK